MSLPSAGMSSDVEIELKCSLRNVYFKTHLGSTLPYFLDLGMDSTSHNTK
jgi:hypothetical protein